MKSSPRGKRRASPARQTGKAEPQRSAAKAATPPARRFRSWWFPVALFVLGLAIYSPSLSGSFVLDDYDLMEVYSAVRAGDFQAVRQSGRPLLMLTYVLNYRLSGFEPFSFHLTNVLLHCLNAVLLWRFLATLFLPGRLDKWLSPALRPLLIYGVPLLFLTSPIQTESVAYISSRSEVLATTFYLSALWLFVSEWREKQPWVTAIGVMVLFAGAALSKQDKLTLPFAILLIDYLLLSQMDWRKMKRNWPTYALFASGMVAGFFLVVRPVLFVPSAGFALEWKPYLFTQFRMHFLYLRSLCVPFGLNADYDITASQTLGEQLSWLALMTLLILIAAAVYYRRRAPVIAFGALFFFVTLAPTSSFYPLLDFAAERRLYLPAIGFFLVMVPAMSRLFAPASRTLPVFVAAVVAVYCAGTYQRSHVWADELVLWKDTVEKSPNKERPWTWLGRSYNDRREYAQAAAAWEQAGKLVEPNSAAHSALFSNLGLVYANLGDRRRAVEYYQQAVEIEPKVPLYWGHLAVQQLRLGRDDEGWKTFEQAFKHHQGEPELLLLRGQEYYLKRRYAEAAKDWRRVLMLRPEDDVAKRNLEKAEEMLRRQGIEPSPAKP